MLVTECRDCGEGVPVFARACAHCGAPNHARPAAVAVAAALALLVVAVAVAAIVVLRWQHSPVDTSEPVPATPATPEPATATTEFAWLTAAMQACDSEAAKEPDTLQFLVIPLANAPADEPEWRAKSLNDIGNAILLNSDAALAGLQSHGLKISTEEYSFFVREEGSSAMYKWKPSVGVVKFSIPDAQSTGSFRIQFQTRNRTGDANWGATFVRQKGERNAEDVHILGAEKHLSVFGLVGIIRSPSQPAANHLFAQ